jgi:hypothetical protein
MTEPLTEQDGRVRRAVYAAFAAGDVPTRDAVGRATGLAPDAVVMSYRRLAEAHVLVLEPGSDEVWMAMPFSAKPTAFRVTAGETAWWANCAWDALGIAAATGCDVEIATDCPDCAEPLGLRVEAGALVPAPGIVHFAVPAAHWWDDIGFT